MGTWWNGTRLVFERGLLESVRSKTFKVVTGILLVLSAAAVLLPQFLLKDTTTYTLATVGKPPAEVVAALDAAGKAGKFDVKYVARDSQDEVRMAVRNGEATVGLADNTMYAAAQGAVTLTAIVAQTVVTLETSRQLTEAGLTPRQVADIQSIQPPKQVTVAAVEEEGRAGLGFAVGLVLYLALLLVGGKIATTVATEKSTRISEVLLAVLRASQILVGTVLAVGTAALLQLLVLGVPLAVALQVSDNIGLPSVATGDIALAMVWFLLGFGLYAFMYAAGGALVDKVTEADTAVLPIHTAVIGAYITSIFVVMDNPDGAPSVLLSIFPITAPLAMTLRWATGEVPVYQLLFAMVLTALTAVALVAVASNIYRQALLITGRRVRFRELIGQRAIA